MDIPYEKVYSNQMSSAPSVEFCDEPIDIQPKQPYIRHYFVFSLFSAVCLCPATGLIALAYSVKSSAKADVNLHDKARTYSRYALIWNIISVILAIITLIFTIMFFYQLGEDIQQNQLYQMQYPYMPHQRMDYRSQGFGRMPHRYHHRHHHHHHGPHQNEMFNEDHNVQLLTKN